MAPPEATTLTTLDDDSHLDESLLPTLTRNRRTRACQHILAAYTAEEPVHVRPTLAALRVQRLVNRARNLEWAFLLLLVSLSVFERPVWCIRPQGHREHAAPCETDLYPVWGHQYMESSSAFAFEAVCLAVQLVFAAAEIFAGGTSYLRPKHHRVHAALLSAAVVDWAVAIATPPTVPRIGPFLRICLLANRSADIRRELWLVARMIPGLSSVLLLTLMTLAFAAFFGLVLFHDDSPHFFGTFWRAMWQLWVLMTTSNFPDVMIKVYDESRAAVFFFIPFVLMATFFMMNLFTAAAYLKYQECEEAYEKSALLMTEKHLRKAFKLLDVDSSGALVRAEMIDVVAELRKAHLLPGIAQAGSATDLLFATLDQEGDDRVSEEEFMSLVTVLKVNWEEEEVATYFERVWPRLYHSSAFQWVRKVVLSSFFQYGCDFTVLLMVGATVWETLSRLHDGRKPASSATDGKIDSFWDVVQLVFTLFFAFEVMLKVIVFGWISYWRDFTNRLEFVTAVGCVLMSVVVYIPNSFDNATWIRYTAFLRILRLFRLGRVLQLPNMLRFLYIFVSVEHIRVFYETFLSMLPAAMRLIKVMFCIVYAYAALGVALFGGLINRNPGDPNYALVSSMAYGQSGYWNINLNDMPSGMVLMFQMLVVNNWMVFAEAYGAVGGALAYTFFITFYFIGVIAGLNILVSFVLDAFIKEMEQDQDAKDAVELPPNGETGHGLRPSASHAGAFTVVPSTFVDHSGALQRKKRRLAGQKWRATMKGYESSSHKAEMLLKLLSRVRSYREFVAAANTGVRAAAANGTMSAGGTPTAAEVCNGLGRWMTGE